MFATARVVCILDHLHNFRNHIAAAFDLDPVADLYSEAFDLIHVVQRCARNRRAANWNRFQPCNGRQLAGAANLGDDVLDLRYTSSGRVLVGNCPARSFPGETEFALPCRAINFDDDAVNFVRQGFTLRLPDLDEFPDLSEILCRLAIRIHFETGQL